MNTRLNNIKEELNKIAVEIKETKKEIKEKQRNKKYAGNLQYSITHTKSDYRHKHIAYCLLRGRKYEEIESHIREGNEPNWSLIKKLQEEYSEAIKDVRTCA